MEARFNMQQAQPDAYKAMLGLEKYLNSTPLTNTHKDLIKIRASQINGCVYCLSMHTRDARKNGETEQRIYLLNAWRECNLYTPEERAILALTEQVTLISEHTGTDAYDEAAGLFSETYLAQILMEIITINAWNRIGIISRLQPE